GVVYEGRTAGLNKYKAEFAAPTQRRTLADAMIDADVFLGCSVGGLVNQDMIRSMAPRPMVFAMANPDPEISYPDAVAARDDIIMATGRSDYPNQVNNVLGFPFIFRGALDVRASDINEEMKVAASHALANLAKEDVPDAVKAVYGNAPLRFGPEYIIPKPFDPRVLTWEAPAVAEAAMKTGVARLHVDLDKYRAGLERIYGRTHMVMRKYREHARQKSIRVVFPEGEDEKILQSAQILVDQKAAKPILLGNIDVMESKIKELGLDLKGVVLCSPEEHPRFEEYCREISNLRPRRGVTLREARRKLRDRNYFAMMMARMDDADAVVTGMTTHYPDSLRPALEVIGTRKGGLAAGMYMIVLQNEVKFFADCTVNPDPTAEQLADIAIVTADKVKELGVKPKIALISFSNFGSSRHKSSIKMAKARELVWERRPDLEIDGEMQFNVAVDFPLMQELYPFCKLTGPANTFIFPNLDAGNAAYKMMAEIGGADVVGPILMGLNKPVEVLQRADSVDSVVRLVSMATVEATGGLPQD
ncbi:MAG: NADP-dependent malic enzyme, partial [Proteobacteria bacterium]|nr:NADP-dependent malic enzyme [Pseudomonadota bacterium]